MSNLPTNAFTWSFNELYIIYLTVRRKGAEAGSGQPCPGHPGLTHFKIYPGLTQIGSREN